MVTLSEKLQELRDAAGSIDFLPSDYYEMAVPADYGPITAEEAFWLDESWPGAEEFIAEMTARADAYLTAALAWVKRDYWTAQDFFGRLQHLRDRVRLDDAMWDAAGGELPHSYLRYRAEIDLEIEQLDELVLVEGGMA